MVAAAFPNLALTAAGGPTLSPAGAALLVPVLISGLLAVACVRPRKQEPDVHDRGLDRIIAGPLLAGAVWLALGWPATGGLRAPATAPEVWAAVALFSGAGALVWGSRMFLRLRWATLVLLLALPGVPIRWPVDAAVGLAALAVAAVELRWRLRRRPARDGTARRRAVAAGSAGRYYFPPNLVAICGLGVLAAGVATTVVHGGVPRELQRSHLPSAVVAAATAAPSPPAPAVDAPGASAGPSTGRSNRAASPLLSVVSDPHRLTAIVARPRETTR